MAEKQTYANHTRWYPLVHFVIFPLLIINLIWAIVCTVMHFDWFRVQYLLMSVIVILISFSARLQALKAQDRGIRLEERMRYREVLPAELSARFNELRTGDIIALRFAGDGELGDLVQQVLDGKLTTSKEIKLAIKDWRGDYLRV
ncbi:MAG TPA: DUF6526 family protein [Pyrinomonadaceae bacterium]|nr:DUF6526 family protein [Pyrinomonadaceae bacterium]